jgi:hypothetical protein
MDLVVRKIDEDELIAMVVSAISNSKSFIEKIEALHSKLTAKSGTSTQSNPPDNDAGVALSTLTAKGKGYEAHGRSTGIGKEFIVLAGSTINPTAANSIPDAANVKRQKLQSSGVIKKFTFKQDYVFDSASAAAAVIGGRSVSANEFWKSL